MRLSLDVCKESSLKGRVNIWVVYEQGEEERKGIVRRCKRDGREESVTREGKQ
jgi:hypothetical protein